MGRLVRRTGVLSETSSMRAVAALLAAMAIWAAMCLGSTRGVLAASPEASPNPSITLTAEPMLGGSYRPGSWAAIRVSLENSGPAVEGELRLTSTRRETSTLGVAVHLPSGARQEHFLYGRMDGFRNRFEIDFSDGATVHARAVVSAKGNDSESPAIVLVAERPHALIGPLGEAAAGQDPVVVPVEAHDLPPRPEPWASADVLVWQDVDSLLLDGPRMEALRTWINAGGHLVVVAGSTGPTTLAAFPGDLLPYRPSQTVEVPLAAVESLVGDMPAAAPLLPALTGPLERGVALAQAGETVVAARTVYGAGTVAVVGFDPTAPVLSEAGAAGRLWARLLPSPAGAREPVFMGDNPLSMALDALPGVQLPPMDVTFLLIAAYIVVVGPLNYVLLRRRDRREWAWLTIPLAIVVFAVTAYGFGVAVRGSDVVVNQIAIVRGHTGSDRAMAHVQVAVYSPNRASFDVRIGGDSLISALEPGWDEFGQRREQPVNVLLGDPATVRDYRVGFGVLRAFRAETTVAAPRLEADLHLTGGALAGSVTNASAATLSDVSVVFGDEVQRLGDVAAGESREISITRRNGRAFGEPLSARLLPSDGTPTSLRTAGARRALIDHLDARWDEPFGGSGGGGVFEGGPVILAWHHGPTLDVDVGSPAEHVGEQLLLVPARLRVAGPVEFSGAMVEETTLSFDAQDGWQEAGAYFVSRGTVVAEYRPARFDGSFAVTDLTFRLAEETRTPPARRGDQRLAPLPPEYQPDPEAPLAPEPRPDAPAGVPRIQLFDRIADTWIEFEPAELGRLYTVADPRRYVDDSGAFRVRFVVRTSDHVSFSLAARLEGEVE